MDSRPQSSKPEEIAAWLREQQAKGHKIHIKKETEDPRVSYALKWLLGIVGSLIIGGGVTTVSLILGVRDQLLILTSRPEPATKEQLNSTNIRIDATNIRLDDLKKQVDRVEQLKQ